MATGITLEVKVTGVAQVLRRLRFTPEQASRLGIPLAKVARAILDDADPRVPVRFGNLRATGKIIGPRSISFGRGQEAIVEYGGRAAKDKRLPAPQVLRGGRVTYAIPVHEGFSSRPFFLKQAFDAQAGQLAEEVGKQVMADFRRIGGIPTAVREDEA